MRLYARIRSCGGASIDEAIGKITAWVQAGELLALIVTGTLVAVSERRDALHPVPPASACPRLRSQTRIRPSTDLRAIDLVALYPRRSPRLGRTRMGVSFPNEQRDALHFQRVRIVPGEELCVAEKRTQGGKMQRIESHHAPDERDRLRGAPVLEQHQSIAAVGEIRF